MGGEAQDGSGPEGHAGEISDLAYGDAEDSILRIEQALERIGARAHGIGSEDGADRPPFVDIAARLDELIAQLRIVLADRPGTD